MQIDRRGKRLVIRWKFEGKPDSLSFAGCNTATARVLALHFDFQVGQSLQFFQWL
jgi:hypothetical protein